MKNRPPPTQTQATIDRGVNFAGRTPDRLDSLSRGLPRTNYGGRSRPARSSRRLWLI